MKKYLSTRRTQVCLGVIGLVGLAAPGIAVASCQTVTGTEALQCTLTPPDTTTVVSGGTLDGTLTVSGSGTTTVNVNQGGSIRPVTLTGKGYASVPQAVVRISGSAPYTTNFNISGTIQNDGSNVDVISILGSGGTVNILNSVTGVIRNTDTTNPQSETIVMYASGTTVNIDNAGLIRGALNPAIRMIESGGQLAIVNVTNRAGASIIADTNVNAIEGTLGAGARVNLRNAGTITGGVVSSVAGSSLILESTGTISGVVNYSAGGSLSLGGASDSTFDVSKVGASQQYRGFTAFNKIESSRWTLSGANAVTAFNWQVQGGTLAVPIAIQGGARVYSGATLGGFGSLAGTVTNEGFVSPGLGGTATGTLSVGGYTQAAGATYRMGLASNTPGGYDRIVSSGPAVMANGAIVDVNVIGSPALRAGYVVPGVVIGSTLTANAASLVVTDNSPYYSFTASTARNPNELDLVAAINADALPTTIDPAAQGAAEAVRTMITSGIPAGMQPVIDRLGTLSGQQASDALSQLVPVLAGAAPQAGLNTLRTTNRIIQSRIESNQGLSSGDGVTDKYLWVRPFGTYGTQDNHNGVAGFRSSTGGITLGGDGAVNDRLRAGAAFTYARSDIKSRSSVAPSSVDVDTYELVGYASYNIAPATDVNFQVDVAEHRGDSQRQIGFLGSTATASVNATSWHGAVGIGRTMTVDAATTVTPSLRADYSRLRTGSYTESGAGGASLQVQADTYEEFVLSANAKVNHNLSNSLRLVADASAGYDFINRQAQATAAFVGGGPTFVTRGLSPSPWLLRAGLSLVGDQGKGVEYSLRYDVEGRTSGYVNQTLSARVRWAF